MTWGRDAGPRMIGPQPGWTSSTSRPLPCGPIVRGLFAHDWPKEDVLMAESPSKPYLVVDFARIPAGARSPLVRKPLKGIKAILNTVFERVAQGCGGEGRLVPDPDPGFLSSRFHKYRHRLQK